MFSGRQKRQNILPVPFYFDVDRLLLNGGRVMLTFPLFRVCFVVHFVINEFGMMHVAYTFVYVYALHLY